MSETEIKKSLELYDYVVNAIKEDCSSLLLFAEKFNVKCQEEKRKLPYHINVIDELHINENGHSRILAKLLEYRDSDGKYVFLQSLINYIKQYSKSSEFAKLEICNPTITQEYKRIDLWVRDTNGYSIIFENKVFGAKDQETQLSRYIKKALDEQYMLNRVFVVYLSNFGKEPDEQSWGEYKEEFAGRFVNLSFKDDILPWLNSSMALINKKDDLLRCAIVQYIDYLNGLFELREINKTFNMNIITILKEKYGEELASKSNKERLAFINEKRKDVLELNSALEKLELEYMYDIFKETETRVLTKYPTVLKKVSEHAYSSKSNYAKVSFVYDGLEYVIRISDEKGIFYCQVEYNQDKVSEQIRHQFDKSTISSKLLKKMSWANNDWCIWKYFNFQSGEKVWDMNTIVEICYGFENIVENCVEIITK